jgi:hypothetical protein
MKSEGQIPVSTSARVLVGRWQTYLWSVVVVALAWGWLYATVFELLSRPLELVGLVCFWPLVVGLYPATMPGVQTFAIMLIPSIPIVIYYVVIWGAIVVIVRSASVRFRTLGLSVIGVVFVVAGLGVARVLGFFW